jgi:hypothetical protein
MRKSEKGESAMKQGHRFLIGALVTAVLAVALALLAAGGEGALAQGTIIYVDADATGLNDGSSWANAFLELYDALDVAGYGTQIWVAEGTYKPTGGTNSNISFEMKNGVAICGGFDPTVGDDTWAERDWVNNVTILSGDIGVPGDSSDNSHHVFLNSSLDSTAVLDGFTITGGKANGTGYDDYGGGMFNGSSDLTLSNVRFEGNRADSGGGMYNYVSSPTLTNVTFSGNRAEYSSGVYGSGGGMYNYYSSPTLTDCTFSGNSAAQSGGGMDNSPMSSPTLTNCTFYQNSATDFGGGMYNVDNSSPTLTNCTFEGNSAGTHGGGMANIYASPTLTDCTF